MTAMLEHRHTIDLELWEKLCNQIMKDRGCDLNEAEAAMDAGLQFLLRAAVSAVPLSPTELEDAGWHPFIYLDTRAYAAWCDKYAGRFIHHTRLDQGCIDDGGSKCSSKCMS